MNKFKKYKNWYSDIRRKLKFKYGNDYKLIAGLIASTSPRFQIKRNINTALKIYDDFLVNGDLLLIYAKNNPAGFMKKYKILFAHYDNILKSLQHSYKKPLNLNGQKVNSFYKNITGNYIAVTLDIWMMKYFKHKKYFMNGSEYKRYSAIIRQKAKRYKMNPAQFQACAWIMVRFKAGFKPVSFLNFI